VRRCVITGATGLIGSSLVKELAGQWRIDAIARRAPDERLGDVNWHAMDLSAGFDDDALPKHVDSIVHLAQSEHFREFPDRAFDVFQVNAATTASLLDYARRAGARSFVLASSGGVYRPAPDSLHEELDIVSRGDLGYYIGTKLCSEILAEPYTSLFTVAIIRFFFVYGPGQRQDMLIPRLLRAVRNGEPVTLQGEHGLRINPTHVSDAARATAHAMDLRQSDKINVGGPQVVALRELCEIIGRRVGRAPVFRTNPGEEPYPLVGDIEKMRRLLSPPRVGIEEGIAGLVEAPGPVGAR
jgi:nucleoside-diphosphate-sugar epimerase